MNIFPKRLTNILALFVVFVLVLIPVARTQAGSGQTLISPQESIINSAGAAGNQTVAANGTFTTLDGSDPSGIVSDDFNACTLDEGVWTLVDPVGDASLTLNGTQALLSVPAGVDHDVWRAGNRAPRLMQAAADTDFELEVKFESSLDIRYQLQGILVEQDADNFLRFDFYSDNSSTRIFAAKFVNGSPASFVNTKISVTGTAPLYMRVTRLGNQWTQAYSLNGVNWTVVADGYSHTLAVAEVGVFVGNAGPNPAHTGIIDYFFNTASPIIPEDSNGNSLSISLSGSGSVEQVPDQAIYACGETVQLSAVADSGWEFDSWSGDLTGSTNPATLVMDSDKLVTATFVETGGITYTLDVSTVGDGTVLVNPDQAAYDEGQTITLTAQPALGWEFNSWSGDLTGSSNPATLVMGSDKLVTATFVADSTPPVISDVQVTPGTTSAVVSWTTDEPSTSSVAYGPSSSYENGSVDDDALVTAHSLTLTGLLENSLYHFQVRSTDAAGNQKVTADDTFTTLESTGPLIDVWYGLDQIFGHLGNPQNWVNILGNVSDPDGVTSLVYSLNGGLPRALSMGPDSRRLASPGDFNVDIDRADLVNGANQIVIAAVDGKNNESSTTVTVNYTTGTTWSFPYSIDWSTTTDIQQAAQVVDGKWTIHPDGLRIDIPDYDRLVAVGEETWTDYEVLVPITIHSVDFAGAGGTSGEPGLGVLMRWQGHTDDPISGWQPKSGWIPNGNIGWWRFYSPTNVQLQWYSPSVSQTFIPSMETAYLFRVRVESTAGLGGLYSLKVWEEDQPEPATWNLTVQENANDLSSGSFLLLAHHVDATFGNVTVVPLPSEIIYTLDVNAVGDGTVLVDPDQAAYDEGQTVTLTAQPTLGWEFDSWSGDLTGNTNPATLVMDSDKLVTATFVEMSGITYTLDVSTVGDGTVLVNPDQAAYDEGQTITLTAQPALGWEFDSWSGDLTGSANPATLVMDSDKLVTATFVADSTPPVISDVQVTPGTTSAVVSWTTDEPSTSSVAYGPSSSYENGSVDDDALVTAHSLTLTGLLENSLYHFQVRSTDAAGNQKVTADDTFTTLDGSDPSGIVSDDFNACTLDEGVWTLVDPVGDASLTVNGTQALLSVPAGVDHDVWTAGNRAPRLMQAAADTDFEIEVKFESALDAQYQLQGILVEQDTGNFLRFDFYSDGLSTRIFGAKFINGSPTSFVNAQIDATGTAPLYMRITRIGYQWTQAYSLDGVNWTVVADGYSHTLAVAKVGVFVGNAGPNPAHTGIIDYFFNTASPITPEDSEELTCN